MKDVNCALAWAFGMGEIKFSRYALHDDNHLASIAHFQVISCLTDS